MTATQNTSTRTAVAPSASTVALASLIAAPLMVLVAAGSLLALAPGWAKNAPDGGNLLTLLLAAVSGALIVTAVARLRGSSLLIVPAVGTVVALAFNYLVLNGIELHLTGPGEVFFVYAPVQAAAYFLAAWLPMRRGAASSSPVDR